jgi:hypothetical protein
MCGAIPVDCRQQDFPTDEESRAGARVRHLMMRHVRCMSDQIADSGKQSRQRWAAAALMAMNGD